MKRNTSLGLMITLAIPCLVTAWLLYASARPNVAVHAQANLPETMQMKLTLTQELLRHLALKDFEEMSRVADVLLKITDDQKWTNTTTPRYNMFAEDFMYRLEQLEDAADAGNIHAATLHYTSLIQTCVDCHEIVRDGQILAKDFDAPLPSLEHSFLNAGTSER